MIKDKILISKMKKAEMKYLKLAEKADSRIILITKDHGIVKGNILELCIMSINAMIKDDTFYNFMIAYLKTMTKMKTSTKRFKESIQK